MTGSLILLTAVELEARGLARELELGRLHGVPFPCYAGTLPAGPVVLAPMGLRARLLPDRWPALVAGFGPALVISTGTCGALDPSLEVGELVLAREVLTAERGSLAVSPEAIEALPGAAATGCPARLGTLFCADRVVATSRAKAELRQTTGAIAVDLESGPILEFARSRGLPAFVLRGVSDSADQPLPPELAALVTPAGTLRAGRALGLALTHPGTLSQALALRRGTSRALKNVARFLAHVPAPIALRLEQPPSA
ncbi:MAG: hypothetical protein ACE5JN_04480 [Candidatus Methylomirabilia bacterium]